MLVLRLVRIPRNRNPRSVGNISDAGGPGRRSCGGGDDPALVIDYTPVLDGVPTFEDGEPTGANPGAMLRPGPAGS